VNPDHYMNDLIVVRNYLSETCDICKCARGTLRLISGFWSGWYFQLLDGYLRDHQGEKNCPFTL